MSTEEALSFMLAFGSSDDYRGQFMQCSACTITFLIGFGREIGLKVLFIPLYTPRIQLYRADIRNHKRALLKFIVTSREDPVEAIQIIFRNMKPTVIIKIFSRSIKDIVSLAEINT